MKTATVPCLIFILFNLIGIANAIVWYDPQQVHIATGSSDQMIIVWNTINDTKDSRVMFGTGIHSLIKQTVGNRSEFVDGGSEKRSQYIHTVVLTGLANNTVYYYMVGSMQYGFSDIFSFKTWPSGENWSPSLAIFGDMGNVNAQSLPRLQVEAARGMYDAMIHVGDFAYNMDVDNARVGDEFMRQIEPLASSLPYMTCPGNHEQAYNFSNYKNRFRMPGDVDGMMSFSFKMGPIRFISTSTEWVFFPQYGLMPIIRHYEWLENELKDANKPENRAKQPWVITYGHRPMYCSNSDGDDCTKHESIIRTGLPGVHVFGWEKIFYENGVDIAFWAHEHSYERLWPVYNRQVLNGSYAEPYTNPKAPVHITTGSAGCQEDHNPFTSDPEDWSAFRAVDYGYTRMKVFNSSHLYMEQVSDDKGGAVIDSVLIIKDSHGPYPYDPTPIKPVGDQDKLLKKYQHLVKEGWKTLP